MQFHPDIRGAGIFVNIEGMDLPDIGSLTIEMLTEDLDAAWLPECIIIESRQTGRSWRVEFPQQAEAAVWITKKDGPTTRRVS